MRHHNKALFLCQSSHLGHICPGCGMKYDDNCFFYHDALTQMTNKDRKELMREKGSINMWVLPMKVCNAGTSYAVPHLRWWLTCILESIVPKKDLSCHAERSSLSIQMSFWSHPHWWTQCWHSLFKTNFESLQRFISNCEEVHKARGVGHQKQNTAGITNHKHGGKCTKASSAEILWFHPDAKHSVDLFFQ